MAHNLNKWKSIVLDKYEGSTALCLYLIFMILQSCAVPSDDEKIQLTSGKVINAIQNNDAKKFISLIATQLRSIGKTEEMVQSDVTELSQLFKQYGRQKNFEIIDSKLFNSLGQKMIHIPILEGDSSGKKIHLNLYFGPPNIMPLTKISGYELIENGKDPSDFRPLDKLKN